MLEYLISLLDTTTILLIIVSVLAYAWYSNVSRPANFPPGPVALPVVGNIFQLSKGALCQELNKLAKQYGDVFSLKMGPNWCVVLNDYEDAREALLKKPVAFAGRPKVFTVETFTQGYKDIAGASYSDTWKLHRKIAHSAIRYFATGEKLNQLVLKVLPKLDQALEETNGKAFEPKEVLSVAVYNILATMCFGHEFSYGDPQLQMWVDMNTRFSQEIGNGLPADFIPFLRYLPPDAKTKNFFVLMEKWLGAIGKEVQAHKETHDPEVVKDLIDCLMKEQKAAISEGSAKADSLTDIHLQQTVSDLFQAGTDTTTHSLIWSVAIMAKHPDIQQKVAEEIDSVIGRDRPPSIEDRGQLPYTEAAIYEMLRYSSVASVGVIHATVEDTTLGNYVIPKDTWVMINHWASHYSDKYWDEPNKFKPEHFLDESGGVRQHPEGFFPFSFGRRVCLGESFAKAEIFLLFVWLFQHYTFSIPPQHEGKFELKVDTSTGLGNFLSNYEIIANKRF